MTGTLRDFPLPVDYPVGDFELVAWYVVLLGVNGY